MASNASLKSLKQSREALSKIQTHLKPFIEQLESSQAQPTKKAQAQAVVALALGTLRYMGARLEGKDEGRKADDPLRQELNQMRQVLMKVEKKRKREEAEASSKAEKSKEQKISKKESKSEESEQEARPTKKKRRES